jgi:hypothetical protein
VIKTTLTPAGELPLGIGLYRLIEGFAG